MEREEIEQEFTEADLQEIDRIENEMLTKEPSFSLMLSQLDSQSQQTQSQQSQISLQTQNQQSQERSSDEELVEEKMVEFRTLYNLPKGGSKRDYEQRYEKYTSWLKTRHPKLKPNSPTALKLYFLAVENSSAASSINTIISSIRSMVKVKFKMDILDLELTTALKNICRFHKYRKSRTFERDQLESFLSNANEDEHKYNKLIWQIGFYGAMRKSEIHALQIEDVKKEADSGYRITITKSKTDPAGNGRTFLLPKLPLRTSIN